MKTRLCKCGCGRELKYPNQYYFEPLCFYKIKPKKNKLIVKNKPKKTTKFNLGKLKKHADHLCQIFYVAKNPYCIVCGSKTDCMHHVVYKSQSAFLRYSESNLVPVCNGCHARHHITGDANVIATIIRKKGVEWFDNLQLLRRKECKMNKAYLENIIASYSKPLPF